jgi:hypothetical protein
MSPIMIITIVFLLAALWHAAASFYFLFTTYRMLGSHTFERPVSPVAADMMQFLGAMNLPYVVASLIGAMGPPVLRAPLLLIVALANLSQFARDLVAHASGRWKRRLLFITIVDGAFGFVMLALAIWQYWA